MYFKKAKWENSWINNARQLIQTKFDDTYGHTPNSQEPTNDKVCILCFFISQLTPFVCI